MSELISRVPSVEQHSVASPSEQLSHTVVENQYSQFIEPLLSPWFRNSPSELRQALRDAMHHSLEAQRSVAALMARLTPIETFAEPLLLAALSEQGWSQLNCRQHGLKQVNLLSKNLLFLAQQHINLADSLVRWLWPAPWVPASFELNLVTSTTRSSLLEAALQNFEATEEQGFDAGSCIYQVLDDEEVIQPGVTPQGFARICRQLNLGEQYQSHLSSVFEPDSVQAPEAQGFSQTEQVSALFSVSKRYDFLCSVHMDFMQRYIRPDSYLFLKSLFDASGALIAKPDLTHSTLKIMEFELPGVVVFWPQGLPAGDVQRCIVYLPHSPEQSLHEFATFDLFKHTLREWLKSPLWVTYFLNLSPLRYRAEFKRRIDGRNVTWDSLLLVRSPVITEPALFAVTQAVAQAADPFRVAWALQLARLKDDARLLVVPTADEDSKSRQARQATYLNTGLSLMTLALGFVPVLGEVLLAASVVELGVDVYNGIKAWQHNDRVAALGYLFDVAESAALAGATAGAVKALKAQPVVDALEPVKLANGQARLWKPDLMAYQHPRTRVAGLKPDAQGIYSVDTRQYLLLDDAVYSLKMAPGAREGVIEHPSDPQAYTPVVQHNGQGTWVHEADMPGQWSRLRLFKRLGYQVQGIDDTVAEAILALTDTREPMLRTLYRDNLGVPPLLANTLSRVRASEYLTGFIARMTQASGHVAEDAQLQLQLLPQLPGWPPHKVVRLLSNQGALIKEYGQNLSTPGGRVQVTQAQVDRGDLLSTLLECLSTEQIEGMLGSVGSDSAQRVQALKQLLGSFARDHVLPTIERLTLDLAPKTALQLNLERQFPSLPPGVTAELAAHMTPPELERFSDDQRLPLRVLEEARSYVQVVRLNRALEGLFFSELSSADSQRLAFHTLPSLSGWPSNVRFVLLDKATGLELDSIGAQTAPLRREVFKRADGYEYYVTSRQQTLTSPGVLACVHEALTPLERDDLGLGSEGSLAVLSQRVAASAAQQRAHSAQQLGLHTIKPWFKSPMRLADGRLGYTLGGRSSHHVDVRQTVLLKDRVAELYPQLTEAQIGQFLLRLRVEPGPAVQALAQLKSELKTLRVQLAAWVRSDVWTQPPRGARVLLSEQAKRGISLTLIRAWRRQSRSVQGAEHTGYELDLNAWPVDGLPVLTANFSHITALKMANAQSAVIPSHFLMLFKQLRTLSLRSMQLRQLPAELSSMTHLLELDLQDNRIILDAPSLSTLAGLTRLESLNLNGSPLAQRVQVGRMTRLKHLYLRYTGATGWPEGVEALSNLETLDLRDNQIRTLPAGLLTEERARLNRVTHLHDNPLTATAIRQLEVYRRDHGIDLGIRPQREHTSRGRGIHNWAPEPTDVQRKLWRSLYEAHNSVDFFRVLEDMSVSPQFAQTRDNLTQRVWDLMQALHDNTELRRRLFAVASHERACVDGIAMIFSDMELSHKVYVAEKSAATEAQLLKLARGMFRMDRLDQYVQGLVDAKIAQIMAEQAGYVEELQRMVDLAGLEVEAVAGMEAVEQQGVAYRLGSPRALRLAQLLSPLALQSRINQVEPLEVQMYFHVQLADDLELPARPSSMHYSHIIEVTQTQLEAAKAFALENDDTPAMMASIEKQGFWEAFLEKKYPMDFSRVVLSPEQRMDELYTRREGLSSADFLTQSQQISQRRDQSRAELITRLTREEVQEHPFAKPPASR
ncbi:NEL-type E3 ubiquitin ligase domain-containing protein [Pseudomonas sp.]|uniref:NEL-type E3 ubiquitin ligase domain-containing protein n=1 Tax=Pseudomonas sp. TaxID=306 RepID=UPI00260AE7FC|nr:NEL-type E3 ubiquitin ligase domain-containing protein [Pseudomonas sp.]